MKKLVIILSIFALVWLLLNLAVPIRDATQQIHNNPTPVISSLPIGQTFISEHNGLYRVDIFFATFSRIHRGQVNFHLKKTPTSFQDLRSASIDASKIKDNHYASFVFSPIKKSKDKAFFFSIDSTALEPKDIFIWYYSLESVYPGGQGFIGSKRLGGDLKFDTYYRAPLYQWLEVASGKISQNKPFILRNPFFYLFLFLSYLFLFGYLLRLF